MSGLQETTAQRVWRGIPAWVGWSIVTLALWGIWAVLSKAIPSDALSATEVQVVSTLGLIPILLVLGVIKNRPTERSDRLGIALALGAGIISSLANIPYYGLLSSNKAAAVVPLTSMYPLITVLLAVPILKERLNWIQLGGILVSLVAIYMFNVQEEGGWFSLWLLMAMVPIAMWGIAGLVQKMSTNHISGTRAAFWFMAAFVVVGAVMALWDPPPVNISQRTLVLAALVGFTLALGNCTILLAYAQNGKASIITPLTGLYPVISIPIAMWKWEETISAREAIGVLCALLAVVLLACESRPIQARQVVTAGDQA
ncbi:MAG: DMT family transporter [Pirellulales bacterium]